MSSRISSFGCTLESLESRQLLSAGALDTSFNDDGKATIDFGGGVKVSANDVAVQTDGKTVVAGDASNGNLALARFNIDGSLDTTFGANHDGKVLTHLGLSGQPVTASAVTVDSDGTILVAGTGQFDPIDPSGFRTNSMLLVRYKADGALQKFNAVEATRFGTDFFARANDVIVQSDGKVIVAGTIATD